MSAIRSSTLIRSFLCSFLKLAAFFLTLTVSFCWAETLEEASKELKSICYDYEDEALVDEAIKNHKKYYENSWGAYRYLGYTENYLTYYSTGCPMDNEYDGRTYEIFKVGE